MPPARASRRRVLQALVGEVSVALAGCGSVLGRELTPPPTNTKCPAYESAEGESPPVYCYPDLPSDRPAMSLEPIEESGALPEAEFTFTLHNSTRQTFSFNPYGWSLHKQFGGEWYHLAPYEIPLPGLGLQPLDEYSWSVHVDNTDLASPLEWPTGDESLAFAGLGAGTYAFGIGGSFDESSERMFFSAPFRLEGQPLELPPTEQVSNVTRRDGIVYVDTDAAVEDSRLGIVTTRLEGDAAARTRLLPEEAIRHPPIRNSLAYVEPGVDRVVLRTGDPAQEFIERLTGEGRPSKWTIEVAFGDGAFQLERREIDPADFSAS